MPCSRQARQLHHHPSPPFPPPVRPQAVTPHRGPIWVPPIQVSSITNRQRRQRKAGTISRYLGRQLPTLGSLSRYHESASALTFPACLLLGGWVPSLTIQSRPTRCRQSPPNKHCHYCCLPIPYLPTIRIHHQQISTSSPSYRYIPHTYSSHLNTTPYRIAPHPNRKTTSPSSSTVHFERRRCASALPVRRLR